MGWTDGQTGKTSNMTYWETASRTVHDWSCFDDFVKCRFHCEQYYNNYNYCRACVDDLIK